LLFYDNGAKLEKLIEKLIHNIYPDPLQVADEIDPNEFNEILAVGHNRVFIKK